MFPEIQRPRTFIGRPEACNPGALCGFVPLFSVARAAWRPATATDALRRKFLRVAFMLLLHVGTIATAFLDGNTIVMDLPPVNDKSLFRALSEFS